MDTELTRRYIVAGLGLHFAVVFCAFLPGVSLSVSGTAGDSRPPLLVVAYSGVLIAFILPLVIHQIKTREALRIAMTLSCLAESCGAIAMDIVQDPTGLLLWCSCIVFGGGTACAAVLWGLELAELATDAMERSFGFSLLLTGLVILSGFAIFSEYVYYCLPLFSLASLRCYWHVTDARTFNQSHKVPQPPLSTSGQNIPLRFLGLAKIVATFGLVSFIWQLYAAGPGADEIGQTALFPLGFIFGALVFLLFISYSSRVDMTSSIRWAFPIMAVGLLLTLDTNSRLFPIGGLLLACAHSSLETMLRLYIIKSANPTPSSRDKSIAWGFGAITLGAVIGESGFNLLAPYIDLTSSTLLATLYTLLIIVEALFWNKAQSDISNIQQIHLDKSTGSAVQRAAAMAQTYGLSNREREVLAYLLDGRSQPYIRDELAISTSTVDTHVRHIYKKVGVNSKQDLIDLSKQPGI